MSDNQPSSNNSDLNMIAISTVAARLALDIRGPASQESMDRVVPRLRFLGTKERPSSIDQEFLRIWNDSQTKKDLDDYDPAVTTEASEGLKIVYRLRYRPTPPPGMEASHVVYTPKFSRLFAELAVHPCWEGNPKLLVMAIQYTVKVRVDDRSLWPVIDALPDHVYNCPALDAVFEMFYDHEGEIVAPASLQQMHLQARDALTEAAPCEFSDFLVFLGQIARIYPSSDYSQTYLGLETLPVTTKDLQILTQAVKRFDWDNIDWTDTPMAVFEEFERKGGLSDDQWPRNNRELKRFMRRALMCSYQTVAIWRDVSETSIPPEETPSDNEVLPGDESGFESD
ncbi:hypothetical protein FMUND_13608 [Fusarium mundagurra]|uniref:Uncharacterized protein n=1 Tax=Fusarium mundagurra TaxID=1567541 RepID=A0A8H5XXR5_9HYPO|nr:hypothetical protein FMUND_13608 [Fusarium mundagurra]